MALGSIGPHKRLSCIHVALILVDAGEVIYMPLNETITVGVHELRSYQIRGPEDHPDTK